MNTMKAFWNDCGRGPSPDRPVDVHLAQAQDIWADTSGVEGNFFGLIDAAGRTIQFYFTDGIPDHVEDASHLEIVLLDLPVPEKGGSYSKQVSVGDVHELIALAFSVGADPLAYSGLRFSSW